MRPVVAAAVAAATVFASLAHAGQFYETSRFAGVAGLSHNGRIATGVIASGFNGAPAWRWTPETGLVMLPNFVDAVGMNAWAQPLAGAVLDDKGIEVAALAYSNVPVVGPVAIGPYPGGLQLDNYQSSTYDVSDDGVAVGLAYDDTANAIAFRWTAAGGMTRLPVNRPTTFSRANGISHDGSLVFGWNDQADGYRTGVIWRNGAPIDLVDADDNPIGEAFAATADGRVVVGGGYYTANGSEAWRWTAATGAQPIGILPEEPAASRAAPVRQSARHRSSQMPVNPSPSGFLPPESLGFAVSDDGNVIVGASGAWPIRTATIWTPETGLQRLADYVTARGVTIPENWFLAAAAAISADGQTIGGWGLDAEGVMAGFVIDLHPARTVDAIVEATGTVAYNDLTSGPFAGAAVGTPVTLSFTLSPQGFEIAPSRATSYPIRPGTFALRIGSASDTLAATPDGPAVMLTNDYPRSDGVHLFATPTASGQTFEFELFNPGGDLFDSDDLNRIDRTVGPEHFEKASWQILQGDRSLRVELGTVGIHDSETIFRDGFETD